MVVTNIIVVPAPSPGKLPAIHFISIRSSDLFWYFWESLKLSPLLTSRPPKLSQIFLVANVQSRGVLYMPFAYSPLYHEFTQVKRHTNSMELPPTVIFEAILDPELPFQKPLSTSFRYHPLYHTYRSTLDSATIARPSPTTVFEAMLDADLTSTVRKARSSS